MEFDYFLCFRAYYRIFLEKSIDFQNGGVDFLQIYIFDVYLMRTRLKMMNCYACDSFVFLLCSGPYKSTDILKTLNGQNF